MKIETLAKEVLAVLDKQQQYFKTREPRFLIQSKAMERKLRDDCKAAISRAEMDELSANRQQVLSA
jgi:hypothetical protein